MKINSLTFTNEITTASGYWQKYELEGNKFIPCCPECDQGMHTRCQSKACKKQNPSLRITMDLNKYYFSRFECFWRWLLY